MIDNRIKEVKKVYEDLIQLKSFMEEKNNDIKLEINEPIFIKNIVEWQHREGFDLPYDYMLLLLFLDGFKSDFFNMYSLNNVTRHDSFANVCVIGEYLDDGSFLFITRDGKLYENDQENGINEINLCEYIQTYCIEPIYDYLNE